MTLSAEEFNQRMEEKLSANEKLLQEVQKTLEQKREVQFRQTQQLYDVKEKATNAEAEIQVSVGSKHSWLLARLAGINSDSGSMCCNSCICVG